MKPVRSRPDRGLALIVVLWGIALLTLLAAGFSFSMRTESRLTGAAVERARASAAADAAIRRLAQLLAARDRRQFEPVSGNMLFDRVEVGVNLTPESARVDLNAAPANLLEGLIAHVSAGWDPAVDAEAVVDAILDWRDTDTVARPHGAEIADYEAQGRADGPRNSAFLSVSELSRVIGVSGALYEALAPLVTVYAWSPQVDAMTASRDVLLAVPGLSATTVDAFIAARSQDVDGRGAVRMLAGAERYLARSAGTGVYSLSAQARTASGVRVGRRAVVKLTGNARAPISVLAMLDEAAPAEPSAPVARGD